ncbi:MAG UNVERIFIED_CONTAM: hypothetical protein LVR18_28985 [Planctomycetaceae bacterium]
MNRCVRLVFLLTTFTGFFFPAEPLRADVRLADIFTDNMVLQARTAAADLGHCCSG